MSSISHAEIRRPAVEKGCRRLVLRILDMDVSRPRMRQKDSRFKAGSETTERWPDEPGATREFFLIGNEPVSGP